MPYSPDHPRYCPRCHKARVACVCAFLAPVNSLPVHFRVHQRELSRVRSTSWLAHCMLDHSGYTVEARDPEPDFTGCALLFPGAESAPWNKVYFQGVVVVDGTWDECAAMIRRSPQLQSLPRISLQNPYEGRYLVRRPPWEGALCTAEALGRLLLEMGLEQAQALLELVDHLNVRESLLASAAVSTPPPPISVSCVTSVPPPSF